MVNSASERHNLMSAPQEKLEWVTPKISLMKAETTDGKTYSYAERTRVQPIVGSYRYGPS
jgi:hypothetical protein